jgi:hypothetical protein
MRIPLPPSRGPQGAVPRRPAFGWLALGPLALGLLALGGPVAAQPIHFRAPHSGDKVSAYQVELPVSREERRGFSIPEQCPAITEALALGAAQWGGQVDKGLWWKVAADCRYHDLITRYAAQPFNDLVSGYDFMNADLAHLPLGENPDPRPPHPPLGGVQYAADLRPVLPLADPAAPGEEMTRTACRIRAGTFRGWVRFDADGPRCRMDERGPGFRVVSVDYGDVNGDTYQDAVLRLIPLGPRLGRSPVVLALTRKGEEEPFTPVAMGAP